MTRRRRRRKPPSPEFLAREARRKEHNAKIYAEAREKLEALKPPDTCPDCPHSWDQHCLPGTAFEGCLKCGDCQRINEMAEWDEAGAWLALDELLMEGR